MKRKLMGNLIILILLLALFIVLGQYELFETCSAMSLKKVKAFLDETKDKEKPFLKKQLNFLADTTNVPKEIWEDVRCFPVPSANNNQKQIVSFVDSFMWKRTYGGTRGHEGTDIMAQKNEPGLYPILSVTDGEITQKGWLEKGGYRIGILAPHGGYFYYAHLDSYADIKVGTKVHAGDILGFMGNTGYGPEGTKGMFPVHLHMGIYTYPNNIETSVNPYWVLYYLQYKKIICAY
ncbi:MAG: M23 family metallopeptidase [Lachnospiraceae bacterium]